MAKKTLEKVKPTKQWVSENHYIEKVLKIDREIAKIVIRDSPSKFATNEMAWFDREDGFTVISKISYLRISKNNRFYYSSSKKEIITYRDGKYWIIRENSPLPLTFSQLANFGFTDTELPEANKTVIDRIMRHFPPARYIKEYSQEFPALRTVAFNSIIKHKLWDLKKLVSHTYGCNYPEAINRVILTRKLNVRAKDLTPFNNCHKLNKELLENANIGILTDCWRFAKMLDKPVNLAWSVKRLHQEHDKLYKYIINITGDFFNYSLRINPDFIELAEKEPSLSLYRTSRELVEVGAREKHCVGSYPSAVDSGNTAIFDFEGFTAQITRKPFHLAQLRGYKNSTPPEEVTARLEEILAKHNTSAGYNRTPSTIGGTWTNPAEVAADDDIFDF